MPKTWPLKRKNIKYTTRPKPGKAFEYSLPLNIILRNVLNITKTTRETKYLLKHKEILVDGRKRNEIKYPVGLMDVLSMPQTKEHFRIVLGKNGQLTAHKVDEKESKVKILKVTGKTLVKGKVQLNLFGSANVLAEKNDCKVGDSVVLQDGKVKGVLELGKGAYALLVKGKYTGHHGKVDDIHGGSIMITLSDGKKIETLKRYAYVVGKEKPEIALK